MSYKYKGSWYELSQELSTTTENKIKKVSSNIVETKVGNSKAIELTNLIKQKFNLDTIENLEYAYILDGIHIISQDNKETIMI